MSVTTLHSATKTLGAVSGSEDRLPRFQSVYDSHQTYVRKTLFWLVPRDAVDDLVQEVFLKIWRKLDTFREESSLKTWIHRITANTAYDYLRSRKSEGLMDELEAHREIDSGEAERDPALQVLIRRGLAALPLKQRMVFVLFYKQELTIEEIAASLKVPKGTVKSRLFHARETFAAFLERNGVTA